MIRKMQHPSAPSNRKQSPNRQARSWTNRHKKLREFMAVSATEKRLRARGFGRVWKNVTAQLPGDIDILPGYPLSSVVLDHWQESHESYEPFAKHKTIAAADKNIRSVDYNDRVDSRLKNSRVKKADRDKNVHEFKWISVNLDAQIAEMRSLAPSPR